ncbi:MAG: aldolase catalytic domain-containing protein [Alicyclobacillaceae bacterium]|nr:aldolase catalytic domain-containing protein [Alicyclobacillaceae bacterium]
MNPQPNIQVLDCTIRDGGLVNQWDFSVDFVRDLYQALSAAGAAYMEIGYKNSPKLHKLDKAGPWAFLDENLIRETIGQKTATKISALVDIGRVDERDIVPREESLIDLIRVACYIKDVDKAIDLATKFHRMGYETSVNIMAVSHARDHDLNAALQRLADSPVDIVYVVDSFGSLVPRDIEGLVERFQRYLPNKMIGIHTHNNLQMAFANTLLAMERGATFLDSSVFGMGRAAGNCPTELLIGYLKEARYDVRPILDIIERRFIPMREKVEWGYTIPYAITGLLDEHPRVAIALRMSADKDKYLEFYERLTTVETHAAHL